MVDGAERADVLVGAAVAHHADGAHRQQHGEGLPDRVVEAAACGSRRGRSRRPGAGREPLAGDLAQAADGEAGAGEGVAPDEARRAGPARGRAARTSSLKSSRSGSTSLSFMRSGRPPTLWWLLIVARGPPVTRRSRSRRGRACPGRGTSRRRLRAACSSKTSMKMRPMILRFCSGSLDAGERVEEAVAASTWISGMLKWSRNSVDHLLGLALRAAGRCRRRRRSAGRRSPVEQDRGDRRIDAAGEAADDAARRRPARGSRRSPGRGRRPSSSRR